MHITFDDQTVLVTGAVGGIGKAIAEGFAARGGKVVATDIQGGELERAFVGAELIRAVPLDIADAEAVARCVAEVEAASPRGRIDIVVHSAGGVRGQVAKPIEEIEPEEWRAIQDANLTGVFNLARAVAPGMKRAAGGRIVVISSRAGLGVSLTGIQSYASAKAGQLGLVRQLAHELGPFAITVNAVAPGFIRSNPDSEKQWQSYGPQRQARMVEGIALRRLGRPEDIAHAVFFLASVYADWITGQTLPVSGGPWPG